MKIDPKAPLARFGGKRPPSPAWFANAAPPESGSVEVEGCAIETLAWGDPSAQGLLLLHGALGHARWWLPVAPILARRYRVVAMSFSGMGLSGRRPAYSVRQMAREAWAVGQGSGLFANGGRPAVVAHSFGGKPAAFLACDHGDELLGTVFVDSQVIPVPIHDNPLRAHERIYASEAEALARFRLAPEQPNGEPWALDALGRGGIEQVDGGWTWQFDPAFFANLEFETGWNELLQAQCPLGFIRGEYSEVVSAQNLVEQQASLPPGTLFVDIAEAWHHIMVDQPIALAATIDTMVQSWR